MKNPTKQFDEDESICLWDQRMAPEQYEAKMNVNIDIFEISNEESDP
jgi:hypothetical protein